jgi:hypothetical protein
VKVNAHLSSLILGLFHFAQTSCLLFICHR